MYLELFSNAAKKDAGKMAFEFYDILNCNLMHDISSDLTARVQVGAQLTKMLYDRSLYRPGSGDESKNRANRLEIFYQFLFSNYKHATTELLTAILSGMDALLSLDFPLMATHVSDLCLILLTSDSSVKGVSLQLAARLLESHVKSREVPLLLEEFFKVLYDCNLKENDVLIIEDEFLEAFGSSIGSILSSQAMDVILFLTKEIQQDADEPKLKKAKVAQSSIRIPTTLLIHALTRMQLNEARQNDFDLFLMGFYRQFTKQKLGALVELNKKDGAKLVKKVLIPALELHAISFQLSYKYWEEIVDVSQIIALFEKLEFSFEKYLSCQTILVEIACHHLDKLLCFQKSMDSGQISKLLECIWKSYKLQSKAKMIIHTHIWTLCHLSTETQVKGFLKTWVSDFESEREQPLLHFAPLFEISSVRNMFVSVFLSRIASVFKYTKPEISKLLKEMTKDTSTFLEHFNKEKATLTELSSIDIKKITNLLKTLYQIPVAFFDQKERECFQSAMYLIEHSLSSDLLSIECGTSCRILLWRFMKAREDRLITLLDPSILNWILETKSKYIDTGDAMAVYQSTDYILSLTLRKALQRGDSNLQKGSRSESITYVDEVIKMMHPFLEKNCLDWDVLTSFWTTVSNFIKSERSIFCTNPRTKFDAESFKSVRKHLAKLFKQCKELYNSPSVGIIKLFDSLLAYASLVSLSDVPSLLDIVSNSFLNKEELHLKSIALLLKWSVTDENLNDAYLNWMLQVLEGYQGERLI